MGYPTRWNGIGKWCYSKYHWSTSFFVYPTRWIKDESGVTRSIIDELYSSDIQADQMKGDSGVTQSIIDEIHSSDMLRFQRFGENGFTGSIIDELYSWEIQGDQMEG